MRAGEALLPHHAPPKRRLARDPQQAELVHPPEDVLAQEAIWAGLAPLPGCQHDAMAPSELQGDLPAGRAIADHQYRARGNLAGILVIRGRQLRDVTGEIARECGDLGLLVATGC